MLEPILKGLVEWIYALMVEIMSYASGELLGVLSMDLDYFEYTAPVISEIVNVFVALGWALLIGNMVFQLTKAMASGLGFEAEDPKIIFLRTFVFSFLLMASRQICDIGLSITGRVIDLLEMPSSIEIVTPDESMFTLGGEAKWLLVIIVGVVLMVQMVKLLFEIGERYVITSVLTFFSPLAFAMGGSRNTNDIFKGWCRMYGSMMILMIMNIVFLKLIMSAMSQISSGGVLIWLVFVVALTRVARKIDSHIGRLGLNPAQTGEGFGSRIPGMMTVMAARALGSTVSRSLRGASSGGSTSGGASGGGNSGGQRGRNGATHAHRYPNPYTNTGSPARMNSSGGLGGASYYMGEGLSSENGAGAAASDGTSVSGGNASVGGTKINSHGNTSVNSSSASGGNRESQSLQSNMAGETKFTGNSPAATTTGSSGQPPLQRKTSDSKAPTGNPTVHGSVGASLTKAGTDIQSANAVTNTSFADIHGSEAVAQHNGSIGHGGEIPLPKNDVPSAAQQNPAQSGGTVRKDSSAASSQHSSLESHGSTAPLPKVGASSKAAASAPGGKTVAVPHGAAEPLPKSGGAQSMSMPQHSGLEGSGNTVTPPKATSIPSGQPTDGGVKSTTTLSSQHGGIEGRGGSTPLPKAGVATAGQTGHRDSVTTVSHSDNSFAHLPKGGNTQGGSSSAVSSGNAREQGSSQTPGTKTEIVQNRSGSAPLPKNEPHPVQGQSLPKAESGAARQTVQSGHDAQKPGGSSFSGSALSKNTGYAHTGATAGGQAQPKSSTPASLQKSDGLAGSTAISTTGGVSVHASESGTVNVSNVRENTSVPGAAGAKPQPTSGGEKTPHTPESRSAAHQETTPQSKIQSTHENTGKTINAATLGAQNNSGTFQPGKGNNAQQERHSSQGGVNSQNRDKPANTASGGSTIPTVGKESAGFNKGGSAPTAAGNTVINKGSRSAEAGHGDKGGTSKTTSFERGGDTNIESRSYTAPERTVEKETKPEYGKDEHLSGKSAEKQSHPSGVHANTAFSRNRGGIDEKEGRINHEYTHGKYDPASANRKTDNQFFVKETLKGSRIKRERMKSKRVLKRGGKNGSGK